MAIVVDMVATAMTRVVVQSNSDEPALNDGFLRNFQNLEVGVQKKVPPTCRNSAHSAELPLKSSRVDLQHHFPNFMHLIHNHFLLSSTPVHFPGSMPYASLIHETKGLTVFFRHSPIEKAFRASCPRNWTHRGTLLIYLAHAMRRKAWYSLQL